MKKIFYLLMAYSLLLTAFTGCNNDDDKPVAEIDKLPPATQTGAIGGLFVDNDFFGVGLLGLVPGNSRLNVEKVIKSKGKENGKV